MPDAEPGQGAIHTIAGLVTTCVELYQNKNLNKANSITAIALADRLRDISESISEASNSVHTQHTFEILKKISNDVLAISGHVTEVQEKVAENWGIPALFNARYIEAKLRHALTLAITCQTRLENVQLFIAQANNNDKFLKDWNLLYEKFEQVPSSCNVEEEISNAFRKLNSATKSLVTASHVSEGSSVTAASSIQVDDAEDASLKALESVPAAVKELVLLASQDRIGSTSLRRIVDEFLDLWDGWHIHYDDITYDYNRQGPVMLGSGGFGIVFAGKLTRRNSQGVTKHRVAVKKIQIEDFNASTVLAEIMREALLHMVLEHHCILPCLGVSLPASAGSVKEIKDILNGEDTSDEALSASILTERMSCNLADALKGKNAAMLIASVEEKLKIVTDIAKAVCFLHNNNIVHRDIKPENVLLNFERGQLKGYAKLADFGNSRRAHVEQSMNFSSTIFKTQGTPLFMPPETLLDVDGCRTTKAWDIWSYGVLLCFVFAYEATPTFNSTEVQQFARDGTLAEKMNNWADTITLENIKHVARQCLDANTGRRVAQDPVSAFSAHVIHSDKKKAAGIFEQAEKYRNSSGVEKDEALAAQLYTQAADLGDARAITNLGFFYERGIGVDKNEARAAHLYTQAAELGVSRAITNLGFCYQKGIGVAKNEALAAQLYKQAADRGDAGAINNLGECYQKGIGVEKDERQAAQLYKQAAGRGVACAIVNFGDCYRNTIGVEKDDTQAAQLYKQAADLGVARAMNNLAFCYQSGIGVEKDEVRAAKLYKQAADLGDSRGITNLGYFYERGIGVEKDEMRAARLYKQAADLGEARAIHNLAFCYQNGIGVSKDEAHAAKLYKQAADLDDVHAIRLVRGVR